ncbi:long-chain acyl-CoA synthetase [Novosphingobium kunmingense]|uniref:Long-chain acyl-CoA synthetase n=1 Tax=Novosphingobium kunmingense TaxID=1211806 RepID=A0A2N0H545_9SPHN|nr:long-chain fatty acid--CoA ligase [Novosphingobium kunmingense]PKB14055.1 long-chain acyl-CoA synthetase [Novosphingobium kunmingense]
MDVNNPTGEPWKAHYAHPCAWDMQFPPLSLPEFFADAARRHADKPLVDFLGRRYSYSELYREALCFAAGLQQRGVAKGDRVGLFLPNVPIYVAAYYGAMIAGAIAVNFSPLYTAPELEAQVEDSGIRALVTIDSAALLPTALEVLDRSSLETLVVGSLADALPWGKGLALRLLGRKTLTAVPKRPDVARWSDVLLYDSSPEPVAIDPVEDLALLQYTGGTTGTPKGAMLTHQNLSANARQVEEIDPRKGERDMIMGVLPLFHVFANVCVLNRTVANGGCIAMLPRFDAGQALKTLERVRATAMPGVPTMYQALLDHPDLARTDFSSLRVCISGGAPLPAPLKERFEAATAARLVEGYGLTETSGVVSTNPYEGEDRAGTIGQPLPATRIRLLDKEDPLRDAPPGEPGELAIQGPQVMRGYWRRPEAAAAAFAEREDGRWLRTGDVATIDAEGYLQIVDRIKDMIAVGGFKVFPSQVEAVIAEHPAVKEVLVIGVPDAYRGESPRAYVTLAEGASETGDRLRDWLNARLGKHERVDRVVVRDSLPKTMIGKLDRKALRAEVL